LGFGLEVLSATLRASARGGIKSVIILLPMSRAPRYGPLIAAIDGEAGQGTALPSRGQRHLLNTIPFLY